jgi:hypothetical protein
MIEQETPSHDGTSRANRRWTLMTSLDNATWRQRLAAPGSRFEPERPSPFRADPIVAGRRWTDSVESKRQAA